MAPRPREAQPAPGLLASAFSFVSREIESFITTATGGEIQESQTHTTSQPEASSSRVTLDERRRSEGREGRAKRVRKRSEVETDRARAKRRVRDEGDKERVVKVARKKSTRAVSKGREREREQERERERERSSEREAADDEDDELPVAPLPKSLKKRRDAPAANVHREVDPEDIQDPEPQRREKKKPRSEVATDPSKLMPPPPPRKSMPPPPSPAPFLTMPGSLFPRSESLIPEPIPAKYQRAVPRPRTPPPPPLDTVAEATEATESTEEGLEAPDRQLSESPGRGRPTAVRTERADDAHGSSRRSSARSLSQQSDASAPGPSLHDRQSAPTALPRSAKGKERAYDTSGEIRVKGMEAELREAREDHARNAHGRDDEEREKDKRRIRILEEEVARLRAQLALKTDGNTAVMPPPPPPPPPPLFKPPAAGTSSGGSTNFLASIRANLKHTSPPVEAPINGAAYGGARSRKTGQPTFNVPSDKMAAFLREMKSVRLRRVGGAAGSMGPPSLPPSAAGDVAGEIPRSASGSGMSDARRAAILGDMSFDAGVAARIFIGEKRKRDERDEPTAGPSKRRETTFIRPDKTGGSSSASSSQSSSFSNTSQSSETASNSSASTTQSTVAASDRSSSLAPRSKTNSNSQLRIWPARSTGTSITTPSLCSDTEDHSEDKPPDTPSDSGRGRGDPARTVDLREPLPANELEIIDVDALETPPRRERGRSESPLVEAEARKDVFAKRPPASPMPLKSPAKPLPPARAKTKPAVPSKLPLPRRVPVAPRPDGDVSDSDDPLAMEPRARTRRTEQASREELSVAGSSREAREPSGSTSASARSRSQSQAQSQSRSQSRSHPPPAANGAESRSASASQMTNHARRRLTLDEELRRAGDSLWRESSEERERERTPSPPGEDLESGHLVAVGTKSSKRGFLARGGGAGPPVFMGEGYVQGAGPSEDEDGGLGLGEGAGEGVPAVVRSRSTSARSGGSRGLRRR